MNEIIKRLKEDRLLQMIIALLFVSLLILLYIFRGILFPPKPQKLPCYNKIFTVWIPYDSSMFHSLLLPLSKYCIKFNIEEKSLDEIKNELIYSIAKGKEPDIVYIDNIFLNKNKDLFSTSTLVNVDTLVAYYNKSILNFLNLKKPRTIDELKEFSQKIREFRQDFYPVGLGTSQIKNKKEIILTLTTLSDHETNLSTLKSNLISALDLYTSFSNPQSENFSYPTYAGDDLENFVNERLALFIGFYSDKNIILQKNPRLDFEIDFSPLNTFPPKVKNYAKFYYLAIPKAKENEANLFVLSWFSKNKLKEFTNIFDLVPPEKTSDLDKSKEVVIDSLNIGYSLFDFIDQEIFFSKLDEIINLWQNNKSEGLKQLETIFYYL